MSCCNSCYHHMYYKSTSRKNCTALLCWGTINVPSNTTFQLPPIKKISSFQIKIFNFHREIVWRKTSPQTVLIFDKPERLVYSADLRQSQGCQNSWWTIMDWLPLCDFTLGSLCFTGRENISPISSVLGLVMTRVPLPGCSSILLL